jgi:c-di-GMP phosphodiesterase
MGISFTILNSLRSRILALVLGLVTLVLTAAIVGIAVTERAETERQLSVQLQTAADTARELLRFRGSQLTTAVEVLTSDFGFREAVSSADAATLASAVENQQRRINADLVIVLSTNGRPLASSFNGSLARTERDLQGLIESDAGGEVLQLYRLIDGRPYQLVIAPILAPNPIGWAAMGFALDDRVAEDMARLLGVDVSFVASDDQHPLFIATSAHEDQRTLDAAMIRSAQAAPFLVAAGPDKLLTWTRPIGSANGSLSLVLQRSLSSALRPYDDIRHSMLLIGGLLLAVATALAAWLARSATKPSGGALHGQYRAQGSRRSIQRHARGRGRPGGDDSPSGRPPSAHRASDPCAHQRDSRGHPDESPRPKPGGHGMPRGGASISEHHRLVRPCGR